MKYVFSGNASSPTRKPFFVGFGHPKYTKKWTKLVWLRFFVRRAEAVDEQQGKNQQEVFPPTNGNPKVPPPKRSRMSKLKQVTTVVNELKKLRETVTQEPANEHQYRGFGRPISAIKAQDSIQSILTSFKLQNLQNIQHISSDTRNTIPFSISSVTPPGYSYSASCGDEPIHVKYVDTESLDTDISFTNT
jgi:hypothetical protein